MISIVREEDGTRVFRLDTEASPGSRVSMLENGSWVKPPFRTTLDLFMRGTPLSEGEVANLVKSGS